MTEDEIKAVWEQRFGFIVTDDPSRKDGSIIVAKRVSASNIPTFNYILWNWSGPDRLANTPEELLEAMKEITPLENWRIYEEQQQEQE